MLVEPDILDADGRVRSCIIVDPRDVGVRDNLALEEWLVDHIAPGEYCLFLYSNAPAVVLGKNQNLWRETDPRVLAQRGVQLARRISGGGAVYHDPGNLNVSIIGPRDAYDGHVCTGLVQAALADLGIRAEADDRHVLTVDGRKVSGAAFCYRRQVVMHHCTLLVHADLDALGGCLVPALPQLATHAVDSVRAPVGNLRDVLPSLDLATVTDAICGCFRQTFAAAESAPRLLNRLPIAMDDPDFLVLRRCHASPEWLYDHNPTFRCAVSIDGIPVQLVIKHGQVEAVETSDPDHQSRVADVEKRLRGTRFLDPEIRQLVGLHDLPDSLLAEPDA